MKKCLERGQMRWLRAFPINANEMARRLRQSLRDDTTKGKNIAQGEAWAGVGELRERLGRVYQQQMAGLRRTSQILFDDFPDAEKRMEAGRFPIRPCTAQPKPKATNEKSTTHTNCPGSRNCRRVRRERSSVGQPLQSQYPG